jgi:[ribosomal protein S18]-alanine N-acetyltransferase
MKCINFALDDKKKFGGFILISKDNGQITGAVVVNKTGMQGYIPENILVYIAVDKQYRGKGLGKQLMTKTFDMAEGSIKLHVEPENPARYLYEKLGFTSKYLEMRLKPVNKKIMAEISSASEN